MKKQERVERFQLRNPKDPTRKYFTVSEYRETFFPERMSARGLLQRKIEEMNLAEKGSELEKR